MKTLLYNGVIHNRNQSFKGFVVIADGKIVEVGHGSPSKRLSEDCGEAAIDLEGKWLFPGVIDDQVHFREPGLTDKADIHSESVAAVAGGVTSYLDMPNNNPPAVDLKSLQAKNEIAARSSLANFGFFVGATNDNYDELLRVDYSRTPGIKLFLGSSTGNMLVDNGETLDKIFSLSPLIAVHSEDEAIIRRNTERVRAEYGDSEVPICVHPEIRSAEACYVSTRRAVERARRLGTRLHILHLSTARELEFLSDEPLSEKRITAEVCVHHLWFTDGDYERLGAKIKCNPAIKTFDDRAALRGAAESGLIDIVATDHAPHLLRDKEGGCLKAASGIPLVQHSLVMMLELCKQGVFTPERVVELMCHNPAELYRIKDRGYIEPGMWADLVVVDPDCEWTVGKDNIFYKCGWSPLEGVKFSSKVVLTFVNGHKVYDNGVVDDCAPRGERLEFDVN